MQTLDTAAPESPPDQAPLGRDARVRLRPHLTLLRRDERDIQLGVDAADATILADRDGSLSRLLELMDGRYRLGELITVAEHHNVSASRLESLVATLAAAGLLQPAGSEAPAYTVRMIGVGPAGSLIGDQLLRAGIARVVVVDPETSGWGGWGLGRDRVQRAEHWSQPGIEAADLTVVVSGCLEADRPLASELTKTDHPHLLVRPRAHGAVVGPLVIPGRTSCLRCGDLIRTRTDPAWPRMLAQLCRTRVDWDPLAADWAAALVTTQVLGHLAGRTVEVAGATLELGPVDWSWQRRIWPADPACGCCWAPRAEW